jgi:hypothetical protein
LNFRPSAASPYTLFKADTMLSDNTQYIFTATASFSLFNLLAKLVLAHIPRPNDYLSETNDEKTRLYRLNRWKNICVSFSHSVLSSLIVVWVIGKHPVLVQNMNTSNIHEAYLFHAFVYGYFLYDTIDNLNNQIHRHTYEMLVHHILILLSLTILFYIRIYLGVLTTMGLLEINSIFLHFRQILVYYNTPKTNLLYRINSVFNLLTLVVFRVLVMIIVLNWIYLNHKSMPIFLLCLGFFGSLTILLMNLILLKRSFLSDYCEKNPSGKVKS